MSQCRLFGNYLNRQWLFYKRQNRHIALMSSILKTPIAATIYVIIALAGAIGGLYSMWLINLWCIDNDLLGEFKNHRGEFCYEESAIIWMVIEFFCLIIMLGFMFFAYAVTEESLIQITKDLRKWDVEAGRQQIKRIE